MKISSVEKEVNQILVIESDEVTLTGSYAVIDETIDMDYNDQHTLYIHYTPGLDSTNEAHVTIEYSPNGIDWHEFTGEWSAGKGEITSGAGIVLKIPSSGTSKQNERPYFFNGRCKKMRLKAKETSTPATYGKISFEILSSHT